MGKGLWVSGQIQPLLVEVPMFIHQASSRAGKHPCLQKCHELPQHPEHWCHDITSPEEGAITGVTSCPPPQFPPSSLPIPTIFNCLFTPPHHPISSLLPPFFPFKSFSKTLWTNPTPYTITMQCLWKFTCSGIYWSSVLNSSRPREYLKLWLLGVHFKR